MRIGVLCPAEIAWRRFMPALEKNTEIFFAGIAIYSAQERFGDDLKVLDRNFVNEKLNAEKEKAIKFVSKYGGKLYHSYEELTKSNDIDAVYVPLPPALHKKWVTIALTNNKHVLVEKPAGISFKEVLEMVNLAKSKNLVLHENYMFIFHKQIDIIDDIIKNKILGDIRLFRLAFGFPKRDKNDFRYDKALGGGALLDAGGYVLKYASYLLGKSVVLKYADLNYIADIDVDIYGSGVFRNDKKITAQVSFGMDNNYKCELEIWGSNGYLTAPRIFTAPSDFNTKLIINKGNKEEIRLLSADDSFYNSLEYFSQCVKDDKLRNKNYDSIIQQANLVEEFLKRSIYEKDCNNRS